MKVSKTVSLDLDLLQRVNDRAVNRQQTFSQAVTAALETWLYFLEEIEVGNSIHFRRSLELPVPPHVIWPFLRVEQLPGLVDTIQRVDVLSDHLEGVGASFRMRHQIRGDGTATMDVEYTEYIEPKRLSWRTIAGDFTAFANATLTEKGNSTEMHILFVMNLPQALAETNIKRDVLASLDQGLERLHTLHITAK